MRSEAIKKAQREAEEFLRRAKAYHERVAKDEGFSIVGTADSGALRRQSLELTRALAEMRKP